MTGLEIALIIVGVCFVFGSFMLAEKLTPGELEQLSRLSKDELNKIVEKTFKDAKDRIDETIDERIDESAEALERRMQQDSNYAISSISEYADEVKKSIHDAHTEVTFLHSMMADKEDELKKSVSNAMILTQKLNALVSDNEGAAAPAKKAPMASAGKAVKAPEIKEPQKPAKSVPVKEPKAPDARDSAKAKEEFKPDIDPDTGLVYSKADRILERSNSNEEILSLHRNGMTVTDIARQLNLGKGQVQLVLDLFGGGES